MQATEKRVFTTYCDHRYLPRAVAMIESLRAVGSIDDVWVYCLTVQCLQALQALDLPGVRAVSLETLEAAYPQLLQIKPSRSTIEYYYTCSPLVIEHVFITDPAVNVVTYLDSDLWFFANPQPIFDHIGAAPVAITPHNFPPRLRQYERFGVFNVGWVSFRRGGQGSACLAWWRDRCLEWCYGYIDEGRFGDQGYLSSFAEVAPDTKVITMKGCNAAPWNIENYTVSLRNGQPFLDDEQLIVFHFHGVKRALGPFYFDNHRQYGAPHNAIIRNGIYRPYVAVLVEAEVRVRKLLPESGGNGVKLGGRVIWGLNIKNLLRDLRARSCQIADLCTGRPIVVWHQGVY